MEIAKLYKKISADPGKCEVVEKVIKDMAKMIKKECPDDYKKAYIALHEAIYGHHFCECLAKKAVAEMENADGTKGEHWTMEQTTSLRNQYGVQHDVNDWYYVMNMMYSDYAKLFGADQAMYARLADAYLSDIDAMPDKALKTYIWTHDID